MFLQGFVISIGNPIEIIKYREIYEYLENITDRCEDIANVIESIVVKHA